MRIRGFHLGEEGEEMYIPGAKEWTERYNHVLKVQQEAYDKGFVHGFIVGVVSAVGAGALVMVLFF